METTIEYVTTAGSRRKRKNAVDMNVTEVIRPGQRTKGRPFKGGQSLRSKRYYVKNHLMVLEKRKLKRYIDKVKKLVDQDKYDAEVILKKLEKLCKDFRARQPDNIQEKDLYYIINISREDQYLGFINEQANMWISSMYKEGEQGPSIQSTIELRDMIMKKHATFLFKACTLLSSYSLAHSLKLEKRSKSEEELEKLRAECRTTYEPSYDHITAGYKRALEDMEFRIRDGMVPSSNASEYAERYQYHENGGLSNNSNNELLIHQERYGAMEPEPEPEPKATKFLEETTMA